MSKGSCARFTMFMSFSNQQGQEGIEIPLPNATHVASAQILFKAMIWKKWAIDKYPW